jgi:hypothetical protein
MFEATQGKELVVKFKNRIGLLFEISKLISESGISLLAVCSSIQGEESVIRLVTDDNLRASELLNAGGYVVEEENVIMAELPHKPGVLKRIAEALALEEIDIRHLYATALAGQERCLVVLRTSNDKHALIRLNRA